MASEAKRCPFCGEEILAVAIKCKHCSEFLETPNEHKSAVAPTPAPSQRARATPVSSVMCPRCGQNDQVQRVSSIVSAGTSTTTGDLSGRSGVFFMLERFEAQTSGTSTSGLAQRLSPPSRPAVGAGMWLATILFFFIGELIPSLILKTKVGEDAAADAIKIASGIILAAVWVTYLINRNRQARPQQIAWETGRRKLEQAYYCHRDDVIFTKDGEAASPGAFVASTFRPTA